MNTNTSETANRIIRKMLNIKCIECGEEFGFSPSSQKFYEEHNLEFPKRCPKCIAAKKADTTEIICVDCGVSFVINGFEKDYFKNRGYEFPKRCRSCREIKRARNIEESNNSSK